MMKYLKNYICVEIVLVWTIESSSNNLLSMKIMVVFMNLAPSSVHQVVL